MVLPDIHPLHSGPAGCFDAQVGVFIDLAVLRCHAEAGIQLRLLDHLWPFWDEVIASTLGFSGIRMRNARPRRS